MVLVTFCVCIFFQKGYMFWAYFCYNLHFWKHIFLKMKHIAMFEKNAVFFLSFFLSMLHPLFLVWKKNRQEKMMRVVCTDVAHLDEDVIYLHASECLPIHSRSLYSISFDFSIVFDLSICSSLWVSSPVSDKQTPSSL